MLPAAVVGRITQAAVGEVSVFNRITLLFMIKEAILHASDVGKPIKTQKDVERIGLCFLMANDLVLGNVSQSDTLLQHVAALMPLGDLLPRETPMEDIVRNRLMLREIVERPVIRDHPLRADFLAIFEEKCGLSYERFVALVWGAAAWYMLLRPEDNLIGEQPYLPRPSSARSMVPVPR